MNRIDKLAELFARFPGIGPRSARRFVYYLLTQQKSFHIELANLLKDLGNDTVQCKDCFRYFAVDGQFEVCSICSDKSRDDSTLMIVEKDVDLENIERSGVFSGKYFVLGGTIPILENEPEKKIRVNELTAYVNFNSFKEIVIALSANPDGDTTGDFVKKTLLEESPKLKVSFLGRGLSTGSELEYSDKETIKNAIENRK